MTEKKVNEQEKQSELVKFRDLVVATLDYYIGNPKMKVKTPEFDSNEHYHILRKDAEQHFQNGDLARLKGWFRDLIEIPVESKDLKFSQYLHEKTQYKVDIFKTYNKRIDKIIERGQIKTNAQFHDVSIMVDQLCQIQPNDSVKIVLLNKLLVDFEERTSA